jgi:hypothetical protein
MTEMEYNYFKTKSYQRAGAVAVDFIRLFERGDKSADVLLVDGDIIQIPSKIDNISIIGAVKNPGLRPLIPGQTVGFYIGEAGGYSWNADKRGRRLIKADTGEWAKAGSNEVVYIGDVIFVPEKKDRDYWLLFKDFMLISAQIATVALVVQNALSN